MDPEEFRAILSRSGVGIWAMIEAAIGVASSDYGDELRRRRDKIVESLYAPAAQLCRSCNGDVHQNVVQDEQYYPQNITTVYNNSDDIDNNNSKKYNNDDDNTNEDFSKSPSTPESNHRNFSGGEEEEDLDPYGGLFDDEQTKIVTIKEQLEDPNQSEEAVVDLLQNLADMDITFQALKETDIGRHVNRLRKHPSNEVRRLVKQLVRFSPFPSFLFQILETKWKETVDEWVKVNQPQGTSNLIADGDSPQQSIPKNQENGHHQVPDFGCSPNPQSLNYCNGIMQRAQREPVIDDERLNSARRRLQENYQEAQNAKKQRTIQVMDIHEIPKPKNAFFAKNKGGFQGRHHR
ncbi:UNVERIFIED_CONTAM: putative mediator of RNA polymerase II transcription subunitc [Sesamum angustifolium]|uniref:Mediator of RNA polymerase II transcription subunitc n=1 Tax=Sesamum angustifolium TaxID=2727405 RepID=A0AAW2IK86_9LAMI